MTVMTLNVNGYFEKHGSWTQRRPRLEAALREIRPDILLLQAVARDPQREDGRDQAAQLAAAFPEYVSVMYHPAQHADDGTAFGSALLSRYPLRESGALELSLRRGLEDTTRRNVLWAGVSTPDGLLTVLNAHFSWVPEQNADNLEETVMLLQEMSGPALLAGDFNAPPDGPAIKRLRELGWTDAWERLREHEGGFSFEADAPSMRIDYMWANPELESRLESVQLVLGREERVSDHLGLVVTLRG
nr:endonuclease/exonuclease/phosphatase family protein [Deinobacterium chartae]